MAREAACQADRAQLIGSAARWPDGRLVRGIYHGIGVDVDSIGDWIRLRAILHLAAARAPSFGLTARLRGHWIQSRRLLRLLDVDSSGAVMDPDASASNCRTTCRCSTASSSPASLGRASISIDIAQSTSSSKA